MSVPTFSLLLTEYLNRAGISDSELARSIGVRRQTVFRWKEGLVERPRAREDVLRCAAKLRLTTEERDLLLLSAGFAPELLSPDALRDSLGAAPTAEQDELSPTSAAVAAATDEEWQPEENDLTVAGATNKEPLSDEPNAAGLPQAEALSAQQVAHFVTLPQSEPAVTPAADPQDEGRINDPGPTSLFNDEMPSMPGESSRGTLAAIKDLLLQPAKMRYGALGLLALLLLVLLVWRIAPGSTPTVPPTATAAVVQVTLNAPISTAVLFPTIHPTAQPGKRLLLVAPFHGYTVNEQYNVAGRLQEALSEEIAKTEGISLTIALWPDEIHDTAYLSQVLTASAASLVIWGEYDSGRVRVNLDGISNVTQKRDFPLSSSSELITTISNTLPREIRMLALIVLGRLLRNQGDAASATTAFTRALAIGPGDAKTRALLNFYLGNLAERGGQLRDLDRSIRYYNDALTENPRLIEAQYNLGTVRLNRSYLHAADDADIGTDLDAAIDNLSTVIGIRPKYWLAYQNRGVARYERNQATDLADALNDFSRVITNDANNSRAYFHRALTAIRAGEEDLWIADFQQTLTLEPTYYPAYNGLCWGYALAQKAEEGLASCDQAVALDPTGASRDSRGIVYAHLGRYADAAADFALYLDWLQTEVDPTLYERYRGPLVETWIVALKQEENPLTQEVLDGLR